MVLWKSYWVIFLFLKKGTNHPERDTQSSNTGCHGDEKSGEKTLHLLQFVVHTNSPGLCLFGVFFFTLVFFAWVVYVTQVQLSASTERIWKKRTPEFANFASILPSKSFCLLNLLTEQKARLKMDFLHLPCVFILHVCSLDLCRLITHWQGRAKIERSGDSISLECVTPRASWRDTNTLRGMNSLKIFM